VLNRVLDGAIGAAVQAFATQRAREIQQRRDEYLSFVAHDLRAPLNAIALALNYLERTSTEGNNHVSSGSMWKILRRNVQQLEGLVGKILRENVNVQAETGFRVEKRLIDLWPLVESVRNDLQPIGDAAKTRLRNAVPEELLVFADASMVRRVFQNLIANAVSYSPGGTVEIGARGMDDCSLVECWVKDDGAGIPKHRLEVIFNPLESDPVRHDGSGLGLGLAIVKTFVEAHGGQVTVESHPGDGSTFRFTLPTIKP
jgi:signal transduction histidine kinase